MPDSFSLDMLFDKDKQAQTFGNAGVALAQWIQTPEAKRMMDRADLVQRWLQDPQKLLVESIAGNPEKQNFLKALKEGGPEVLDKFVARLCEPPKGYIPPENPI